MRKILEEIRNTALSGDYADALLAIEQILSREPDHVDALRLKGNILELRALDRAQGRGRSLLRSSDYLAARKCYEEVLGRDQRNTLALIDLGDHFRNLGAVTKALDHYERAIALLSGGRFGWSRKEEIAEAFGNAAELYREVGKEADSARVEQAQRQLVSRMRARQLRQGRKRRSSSKRV